MLGGLRATVVIPGDSEQTVQSLSPTMLGVSNGTPDGLELQRSHLTVFRSNKSHAQKSMDCVRDQIQDLAHASHVFQPLNSISSSKFQ